MIGVTFYTRAGCHLCEQVEAELAGMQEQFPHTLSRIDVESSPDLLKRYGLEIPVVEVGVFRLKAPITRQELETTLAAAAQQQNHTVAANQPRVSYQFSSRWSFSDSLTLWLSKHYLAIINLLIALYVGLPFLAPVLMKSGANTPAALIYRVYGGLCHQLSYRSIFLFGEQTIYPRAAAGVENVLTYGQATGLSEGNDVKDVLAARQFIGNPAMGYKVALCQRDVALYGSILAFGLLYAVTGRRIPALPWYLWLLFGILPVAIDGMSQLLSQPPFAFFPFRESTLALRFLTGALFGFMTAWFGIPVIEKSMQDTRQMMEAKRSQLQNLSQPAAPDIDAAI